MTDLTHLTSVTDFRKHARSTFKKPNDMKGPLLDAVHGKVQLIPDDLDRFWPVEDQLERPRLIEGLGEGEQAILQGRVLTAYEARSRRQSPA